MISAIDATRAEERSAKRSKALRQAALVGIHVMQWLSTLVIVVLFMGGVVDRMALVALLAVVWVLGSTVLLIVACWALSDDWWVLYSVLERHRFEEYRMRGRR